VATHGIAIDECVGGGVRNIAAGSTGLQRNVGRHDPGSLPLARARYHAVLVGTEIARQRRHSRGKILECLGVVASQGEPDGEIALRNDGLEMS
jgi:hypothetical protein